MKHFLELNLSVFCWGNFSFVFHRCLLNIYHLTTENKEVQKFMERLDLL